MTWCGKILSVLAVAGLMMPGRLQAGISLDASVDKAEITIGDPVRFDIAITYSPDIELYLPGLNIPLGGFEIRDYKSDDTEDDKTGGKRTGITYVITTYSTGNYVIPPVQVAYRSKADSTGGIVTGDSIKITVKSIKPSEAEDIKDLKSPADIPAGPMMYIIIGAMVLVLAGTALYWFSFRPRWKKHRENGPEDTGPPRPPHEVAYEALDQLQADNLPAEGRFDEFYTRLSEIIRAYVAGRYGVFTLERTTWEIMEQLKEKQETEALPADSFGTFFNTCDMVKFARSLPTAEQAQTDLQGGRELVEGTRRTEPSGPEAEEGGGA